MPTATNETLRTNEYLPLYEAASTKLARKTHVDIMNKVQVNIYAAGRGSDFLRGLKMSIAG